MRKHASGQTTLEAVLIVAILAVVAAGLGEVMSRYAHGRVGPPTTIQGQVEGVLYQRRLLVTGETVVPYLVVDGDYRYALPERWVAPALATPLGAMVRVTYRRDARRTDAVVLGLQPMAETKE